MGALLATSAMVRPPLPEIEPNTATGEAAYWISSDSRLFVLEPNQWRDLKSAARGMNELLYGDHPDLFRGSIGRYEGWRFAVPPVSQHPVDETLDLDTTALTNRLQENIPTKETG